MLEHLGNSTVLDAELVTVGIWSREANSAVFNGIRLYKWILSNTLECLEGSNPVPIIEKDVFLSKVMLWVMTDRSSRERSTSNTRSLAKSISYASRDECIPYRYEQNQC
jgi:hypothetical protein